MKYVNKCYDKHRIHIGLVADCKKGDKYGLIYGFRKPPYNGKREIYEKKILYFEKELSLEIEKYTLVSYLSVDYNGFKPNVRYVYPLSRLVQHNDMRGIYRADGIYHDDETWRLINEGVPYVDFESGRKCCIHYPIINDNICTVWQGLWGCGTRVHDEWLIYEMYNEITSINYIGWPSLGEVTDAVSRFTAHINSINVDEIIDTFQVMRIERLIRRVGRDDHYIIDKYQNLPNDDKYLSYLLPTKEERISFDDNWTSCSDEDNSGEYIMEEETTQAIEKAKADYSKEKHLAFLINDYFSNVLKKKERKEFLSNNILKEFDVVGVSEIVSKFNGEITDEMKRLIDKYNDSTVVGSLEVHPQ